MVGRIVLTDKAPKPLGPYSQAVRAGDFLFLSGMLAVNPSTGKIEAKDVKGQTEQIIQNAKAILESIGANLSDVVKANVYLVNQEHFQDMNSVYRQYFGENPPARTTVVVALPVKEALVEIDFIAYLER